MARHNYDECLRRVLAHEGGYVNHPQDPGGETNHGITVAVARANGYAGPMRDIPMEAVKRIYRAKYWDALACDDLPAGVDYAMFDYGVNSGIARSAKVLQRLCGVADDGRIGPMTLKAVAGRDPADLVERICDERLAFLKRLKTWPTFGKGWGRRVSEVRVAAIEMAHRIAPERLPQRSVGPLAALVATILARFGAIVWRRT